MKMPDLALGLHSFRQFALLQTDQMVSETLQKGYDKYKRDWEQRQNEEFINENKVTCFPLRRMPGSTNATIPKSWTCWRRKGRSLRGSSRESSRLN